MACSCPLDYPLCLTIGALSNLELGTWGAGGTPSAPRPLQGGPCPPRRVGPEEVGGAGPAPVSQRGGPTGPPPPGTQVPLLRAQSDDHGHVPPLVVTPGVWCGSSVGTTTPPPQSQGPPSGSAEAPHPEGSVSARLQENRRSCHGLPPGTQESPCPPPPGSGTLTPPRPRVGNTMQYGPPCSRTGFCGRRARAGARQGSVPGVRPGPGKPSGF